MTTTATTATPPTPMTIDSLETTLDRDFHAACDEFTEAREQRAGKDSPAHRTAVGEALARIDAVLDMYLETRTAR